MGCQISIIDFRSAIKITRDEGRRNETMDDGLNDAQWTTAPLNRKTIKGVETRVSFVRLVDLV
jgi:hypothetical protein